MTARVLTYLARRIIRATLARNARHMSRPVR